MFVTRWIARTGRALSRSLLQQWPIVLTTSVLACVTTAKVLNETGGAPAAPLDDTYIHFQYARSFASLEPFVYSPGAEPTPGATSIAWPLLLALFYALGFTGTLLIWPAWVLGWCSLGLLAYETHRAARGLTSAAMAAAGAAMVLLFGGSVWFAASAMEVLPLSWLLMRSARRCAEWWEASRSGVEIAGEPASFVAQAPGRAELLVLAYAAPLMRPEGALASVMIALTLGFGACGRQRAWAALALLAPLSVPLTYFVFTGETTSTTAKVKWLFRNPYYDAEALWQAIAYNLDLLFTTLLDGRIWSALFIPAGGGWLAALVLPSLVYAGYRQKRLVRAGLLLIVALGILIPTTYDSFLWNRLRYLWPFAPAWFVGLAALSEHVGFTLKHFDPRFESAGVLVAGAFVGAFSTKLSGSMTDVAESADAIRRQQVALGQWAHDNLPESTRIGVNDTGAIAYFSGRRTFDVVGLTTQNEARYWVAGAGSRFEHYERLPRSALPTHFFVYEDWFALPPLLGRFLTQRSVPDATILGGTTMVAHRADYQLLGSGQHPDQAPDTRLLDEVDVADLESEAGHAYQLFDTNALHNRLFQNGAALDGGRAERSQERMQLQVSAGAQCIARLGSEQPLRLEVTLSGHKLAPLELRADPWQELSISAPADLEPGRHELWLRAANGVRFTAMHYWCYAPPKP